MKKIKTPRHRINFPFKLCKNLESFEWLWQCKTRFWSKYISVGLPFNIVGRASGN